MLGVDEDIVVSLPGMERGDMLGWTGEKYSSCLIPSVSKGRQRRTGVGFLRL